MKRCPPAKPRLVMLLAAALFVGGRIGGELGGASPCSAQQPPTDASHSAATSGEPRPLWPADLAREADAVPPAIGDILRGLSAPAGDDYEETVLRRADDLVKAEPPLDGAWAAEKALRAALRFSRAHRPAAPGGDNPWAGVQKRLEGKLLDVRRHLLQLLAKAEDPAEALRWADVWVKLYPAEGPLGEQVQAVWARHAQALLDAGKGADARRWLDRIDHEFVHAAAAEPLRAELRARATKLLAEAKDLPDAKAVAVLEQALSLSPRLPGLRDEWERRRQRYRVLYVAVRDLPEYLSPALAWSDAERQAGELMFEGLVRVRHDSKLGPQYRPGLAEALTAGSGTRRPITLRRDAYWADGERLTAADVRHTIRLLTTGAPLARSAWRDVLELPRLGTDPFHLDVTYTQGLLDPWAPLRLKVLPQQVRGKPLERAEDVDFARAPVGSGPYQVQGREGADGRVYLVLRANPRYLRRGRPSPGPIREVRFFVWRDGDPGEPAPHLALDITPAQGAALKKHAKVELRNLEVPRVHFLGLNHRRAPFTNLHVRKALALAIDRAGLLKRHFLSELPGAAPQTVNGLFPRNSWANSAGKRVPEELYRADDARSAARLAGKDLAQVEWTLKYPEGDPQLDAALKELAEQVGKVLAGADARVAIRPVPLPPRALQQAVGDRDYDLVYHHVDDPASPETLWPLFDPDPAALEPGGSNFLGYAQGTALQALLRSALHHRQFSAVRDFMQGVHAQLYDTMPLVPLWQLPYPVATDPKLHVPDLDALAVFDSVLEWKLDP